MPSSDDTSPSSDSDSGLPPQEAPSDSSPSPADLSVSLVAAADGPESSNSSSNSASMLSDDGGSDGGGDSPSSSPPSPPSSDSSPPIDDFPSLTGSTQKASPPPEASPPPSPHPPPPPPPRSPPPSPPPPQASSAGGSSSSRSSGGGGGDGDGSSSSSDGGGGGGSSDGGGGSGADPPPSDSPTEDESPVSQGSPPSPKAKNLYSPQSNGTDDSDPETVEFQPFETPNPPPPEGDPGASPSPGGSPNTAMTTKQTPSSSQQMTTAQSPGSNFLPRPTSTGTNSDTDAAGADNATPKTTNTPNLTPNNSSPSSSDSKPLKSSTEGSHTPPSGSSGNAKVAAGAVAAGFFLIILVAVLFVFSRKKKKKGGDLYPGPYMPPNNFCVKSDGNYYPHQHMGNSGGSPEGFYTQVPHTPVGNSFGSQRGTGYSGSGADSGVINSAKFFFSYEELMEITSGFSRQNILGEGGFGCVFKGWLPDGKPVAVKQLKAGSGQGEREFKAEVEIISRVHHRHLVSLVGYCVSENHRLLIYEFVPNMTLEHHLHSNKGVAVLEWSKRLKIALGAAKGLAYLHEDCHPKIIHRDIKSANILLDDAFEAQVADFGLAKLTNDTHTHVSTRVMGTFGYMAPEYASSGKLTDRSDVFSFGVVLLELITGRKPVDPTQPLGDESLVEWARPHLIRALETGEFGELTDPRLEKHYVESEMFRMIEAAAACVRHSAPKRPRMVQVVRALDTESDMSDLSNGVKLGQSTMYDSGQYSQDISRFRRMALGGDSSEYDVYSSEYNSREMTASQESWRYLDNSSSGEQETRAFKGPSGAPQS